LRVEVGHVFRGVRGGCSGLRVVADEVGEGGILSDDAVHSVT
jgi:hypothetical protein